MTTDKLILESIKEDINNLHIINVVNEDIKELKEQSKKLSNFKDIIIIAIGGSSLGSKALINFSKATNSKAQKIHYIENTDPQYFLNTVSKCDMKTTGIIVISKSGKTSETLLQFLTLIEMWENFDFENNTIVITENTNNDLRNLSNSLKIKNILDHPTDIGGRFSVFSLVGLLPSILGGIDVDEFLAGAKEVLESIRSSNSPEDLEIFKDAKRQFELYEKGVTQHVLMVYSDYLEDFAKWFRQLVGESLGKRDTFGITPMSALGSVDQHSMLQLFIDGPKDKFFTVIGSKKQAETKIIKKHNNENFDVIKKLEGHKLGELMLAHQKATATVLEKYCHSRFIEVENFDIRTLGNLMMTFIIETLIIAKFAKVDPFNQPAVEESKKIAFKILSQLV